MPSLQHMRRRIRSVRNTAQITKAMEMVAASRMRRAQQRALDSRPYAEAIQVMVGELSRQRSDAATLHPLQRVRPEHRVAFVVFTSDRGLAGPLNGNVLRRAATEVLAHPSDPHVITVGRKGQDFFSRRGWKLTATFTGVGNRADYADVLPIARIVRSLYENEETDAVYVVYPQFVTTLTQRPALNRLLPLRTLEEHATPIEFIIEPDPEQVLDALLPRYLEVELYHTLLEAVASEHSARMVAMRNATENALELVESLTLVYNKARQTAITTAITEISSASEALGKAS